MFAKATAVVAASSESSEASLAKRILVGKIVILCLLFLLAEDVVVSLTLSACKKASRQQEAYLCLRVLQVNHHEGGWARLSFSVLPRRVLLRNRISGNDYSRKPSFRQKFFSET